MIRVELSSNGGALRRAIIVTTIIGALGVGAAGLYLLNASGPLMHLHGPAIDGVSPDLPLEDRGAQQAAAGRGDVDDAAGRRATAADIGVEATDDVDVPKDRPRGSVALSQLPSLDLPMQSAASLTAVELYRHLPSAVRFTSMQTTSDGQFMLEGLSPVAEVESLFGFLDALREVPSQVSLSYWGEGGDNGDQYRFAYRGVLEFTRSGQRVNSQTWTQAAATAEQVATSARESGLRSVSMGAPVSTELGSGMTRLRHELRARGTFPQILAFARAVRGATARATLAELVIEPLDGLGRNWREAKLYADVDIVVAH